MSYELIKPYTEQQRVDFVVQHNHQGGLIVQETPEALFALEANEILSKQDVEKEIQVLVSPEEYEEKEVFDTKEVYVDVVDEEGNPILDEDGYPQYEVKEEKILVKEYTYNVYEVDENDNPVFDENGEPVVKETVTVPEHYKTHTEKVLVKEAVYETQTVTVQEERPIVDPDYEAKLEQAEAERLARLNLTAADVERAIYKAIGLDFDDILAKVQELNNPLLDVKALKIEFKANNFYRGNPYIDMVGSILGFTKEMLDKFFETNNYEYLIPKKVDEEETVDEKPNPEEEVKENE